MGRLKSAWCWCRALTPSDKFSGIIAFLTFVLAGAAISQWWAFIESERSYLIVKSGGVTWNDPPSPKLNLVLVNGGKGVGTVILSDVAAISSPANVALPDAPRYLNKPFFLGPIATGEKAEATLNIAVTNVSGGAIPWSPSDTSRIGEGKDRFYVYGRIKYRDRMSWLKGTATTAFCFTYMVPLSAGEGKPLVNCDMPAYISAD
jgi:hypothetical protein